MTFVGKNAERTFIKTLAEEHWDKISYETEDLLLKLLAVKLEERVELEEAAIHEWFGAISERKSRKSVASENNHELDEIKLEEINLKKKRGLSEEHDSEGSEHTYTRDSK